MAFEIESACLTYYTNEELAQVLRFVHYETERGTFFLAVT